MNLKDKMLGKDQVEIHNKQSKRIYVTRCKIVNANN